MIRLGLTGSIATGKSTALEAFADLGVPVFSADAAVHTLYEGRAVAGIEALFPGSTRNGKVDRQALSAMLLADPDRLGALEALVHPMVRAEIAEFFARAEARGAALAVIEVPLLLETGYDYGLDGIVVIHVDDATQRARALARPGMSVEKLEAILARQMPQAEKKTRADHLLDNSGTPDALRAKVAALVGRLTAPQRET